MGEEEKKGGEEVVFGFGLLQEVGRKECDRGNIDLSGRDSRNIDLSGRDSRSTYPSGAKSEAHILRAYWHGDRDVGVGGRRGGVVRDGEDNAKERGLRVPGPAGIAWETLPRVVRYAVTKERLGVLLLGVLLGSTCKVPKPGQTCWNGTSHASCSWRKVYYGYSCFAGC